MVSATHGHDMTHADPNGVTVCRMRLQARAASQPRADACAPTCADGLRCVHTRDQDWVRFFREQRIGHQVPAACARARTYGSCRSRKLALALLCPWARAHWLPAADCASSSPLCWHDAHERLRTCLCDRACHGCTRRCNWRMTCCCSAPGSRYPPPLLAP